MLAFVLVALKECDVNNVLDELKGIPQIKEVHVLFGEWDLLAKVHVQNTDELGTFMMEHVRKIPEVRLTSTLIVAKS